MLGESLTVQIDTREKYPLQFPSNLRLENPLRPRDMILLPVHAERITLPAGDYRLKEFPASCIIERKASLLELNKNLLHPSDLPRQSAAFKKLSLACEHPVLLLETSPWEILSPSAKSGILDGELVMGRLAKMAAHYGLQVFWAGRTTSVNNRRLLGHTLLHMMLAFALNQKKNESLTSPPISTYKQNQNNSKISVDINSKVC
jgi:ERCC4-type nuclease